MTGKGESKITKRMRGTDKLSVLYEVGKIINSTLDLDEVLNLIVDKAVHLMKARVCSLRLLGEEGKLILRASYGHSYEYWQKKGAINLEDSPAAIRKQPVIIKNVQKDKNYKYPSLARKESLTSLLSVPLPGEKEIIGVLNVYTQKVHSFRKEEVELLSHFASQAAIAIGNALLHQKLHQTYLSIIKTLATAIEAQDKYTYGHSERVVKYAQAIAKEMCLTQEQIERLENACWLHDIGKIGVDRHILNKPGELNEKEWIEVKTHPVIGEKILKPLEFLGETVPLVRQHQEKYNGKGYPNGLKGEEILLEARILAVADAYEAMTSERPYRTAHSPERAKVELKKCAGSQFDPRVIKAFLLVLEKKKKGNCLSRQDTQRHKSMLGTRAPAEKIKN